MALWNVPPSPVGHVWDWSLLIPHLILIPEKTPIWSVKYQVKPYSPIYTPELFQQWFVFPVSWVCVTLLGQSGDLAEQAVKSWLKIPSSGIWLEAYRPLISFWASYIPQFLLWKVNQLLTLWGKPLVQVEFSGSNPHLCPDCWISILGSPVPEVSNFAEPGCRCSVRLQEVIY